jgi:hypothetical protein
LQAAGFGPKWQNALRVVVYPKNAESIQPTIQTYHKIGYSQIFEEGGSIFGKPLLWLPIEKNLPRAIGAAPGSAVLLRQEHRPAVPDLPGRQGAIAGGTKKTGRRGKRGAVQTETVPMFVGIDQVTLGDKFHIREIADTVAGQLPALFARRVHVRANSWSTMLS